MILPAAIFGASGGQDQPQVDHVLVRAEALDQKATGDPPTASPCCRHILMLDAARHSAKR
jgi:hypothetical protein